MNSKAEFFDHFSKHFLKSLPQDLSSISEALKEHLYATAQNTLAELEFVPRDEFDAIQAILHRCQTRLNSLEEKLKILESDTPK